MVMKMVVLAMMVGVASAATAMGRLPPKPKELAHKEGCYIQEINDVVPFGSVVSPIGQCYSIYCSKHMLDYESCGTVGTDDPKCYVTDVDIRKPFPSCCPDVKCDIDNNLF